MAQLREIDGIDIRPELILRHDRPQYRHSHIHLADSALRPDASRDSSPALRPGLPLSAGNDYGGRRLQLTSVVMSPMIQLVINARSDADPIL